MLALERAVAAHAHVPCTRAHGPEHMITHHTHRTRPHATNNDRTGPIRTRTPPTTPNYTATRHATKQPVRTYAHCDHGNDTDATSHE